MLVELKSGSLSRQNASSKWVSEAVCCRAARTALKWVFLIVTMRCSCFAALEWICEVKEMTAGTCIYTNKHTDEWLEEDDKQKEEEKKMLKKPKKTAKHEQRQANLEKLMEIFKKK